MNRLYFDNVIQIGKLYLEHIFYEFESEPVLFTCSDEQKNLYFCLCSDIRYGQRWIIMPCSLMQLEALIEEKADIASVFLSVPYVIAIDMDLQGDERSSIIDNDKIDRVDLPKEGTYVRCNKEQARNYLWNKKWEIFCQQLKSTMEKANVFDAIIKSYKTVIYSPVELLNGQMKAYSDTFGKMLAEQLNDLIDTVSQSVTILQEYSVEVKEKYAEMSECVEITEKETADYIQAA